MKGPQFTLQEQKLINSLMRSLDPDSPIYLDMLEKYLANAINNYEFQTGLVTDKAAELIRTIHNKVASFRFDQELEKILQEPTQSTPSVKGLSFKKTRKSAQDIAEKILTTLRHSEIYLSRREIAERAGLRLQTVCGSIKPLIDQGLVVVIGSKIDNDSQRTVEILGLPNA